MNLTHLVEEFAKACEANEIKSGHEGVMSITLGEFELFFSFFEQRNSIMLHTSLATHDASKDALAHILEMNTFFAKTGGICLGIDAGIITAQKDIYVPDGDYKKLPTEVFVDQCATFLEATFILMEYFNDDDKFAKDVAELKQTEAAPLRFEEGIRC